jgi:hypothetical protein
MCLMLYIAAAAPIGKEGRARLTLEDLREDEVVVRQWFSLPHVMFVGVDGGCSCAFESARAETAIPYYEGMFEDDEDREDEIAVARELISLIRECFSSGERVELYPVWYDSVSNPPKGTISLVASELDAPTFFFNEQFFYEVTR